ncbi:MAG: hypothetical protein AB7W59_14195 [Acidimicrobiia bacterium]
MSKAKFSRGAVAASLLVGLGATALSGTTAGAQSTASDAYLTAPAGSALGAGEYAFAQAGVSASGNDAGITVIMSVGSGDDFTLQLAPKTGSSFGTTNATETATAETASAQAAQLTLTRQGRTCTTPTGEFTLDSATFGGGGGALSAMAVRFKVDCANDSGLSAEGFAYWQQPLGPLGSPQLGEFTPIAPVRLLDTRTTTALGPAGSVDIDITANSSGVPANALAVVVNVTGVAPSADTFLTLYPKGQSRPVVSNLNPRKDDTVANLATVKVGADNAITLYNDQGTTHAVLDVVGYYAADNTAAGGDRFVAQNPQRKYDTRLPGLTPLAEGETRQIDLGTTADAVVLNVTVTAPTKGGYLTVFPGATATAPTASNLNFVAGQTIANLVVMKADNGVVKLYNPAGTTHVVLDLVGTYVLDNGGGDTSGRYVAVDPVRAYDSREGLTRLANNESRKLSLLHLTGKYPFEYTSVAANMTATNTGAAGFLTAFPASELIPPFTSNLNWLAGETRPNQIYAGTSSDGFTKFYNEGGTTDLILDVAGYFTI